MRTLQIWIVSLALAVAWVNASNDNGDHILKAYEDWLASDKVEGHLSENAQRSLIGSLLGSLAVNSPGERGVLSTLFPTLFPAPSNSSLNQGILDRVFNNAIKAQILQAEADYINLNAANTALATQTAALTTWKTLCNATVGASKNLTTGIYYIESSTANAKNWFGARNFCRGKGMDLLNVENAEEAKAVNDEILKVLNQTGALTDAATNIFWIGLNEVADSGTLRFSWEGAQSGPANTFSDFYTNPVVPVLPNPQCVQIAQKNGGQLRWTSNSCSSQARFVCEMPEPCRTILRA